VHDRFDPRPVRCGPRGWRPAHEDPAPLSRLRVLTLNTWFDDLARSARLTAQFDAFRAFDADVIALQEDTPDLVSRITSTPWVREQYALPSDPATLLGRHGYGVFLLVRPPVARFRYTPLSSGMGRGVLCADLSDGVSVGTVHLESLEVGASLRVPQLRRCQQELAAARTALLVGDFNFCHTFPEQAALAPPWTDLWPLRHGDDPGWTYDSVANPMRPRTGPPKQVRYDRMILRDDTHAWRVGEVERVGVEPVADGVWLSDHFGLRTELQRG
jgi:endonuclease/exonuclease/phosphatase family metal-dependent hydrolase